VSVVYCENAGTDLNQGPVVFGHTESVLNNMPNEFIWKACSWQRLVPWIVVLKSVEEAAEQ
jgi:hypothetical protein